MNRSVKPLLYSLVPLAIAVGGFRLWQGGVARHRWEQLQPVTPAAVRDSAPGLAARLAACAAKFARWPIDQTALTEFTLLCQANGLLPDATRGYPVLPALVELRQVYLARFGTMP